jgi:glycosyltransferase involved in cell wall biosynthesis
MESHEKTLVVLIPGFPADESDSTCLPVLQQVILHLKKYDPHLYIKVLAFQYPYVKKNYLWHNIPVTSFDGRNKGGFARWKLRRKIRAHLRSIYQPGKPTCLLSCWYGECAYVGQNFADNFHIRHICWSLGQDARKQNTYPRKISIPTGNLAVLSDLLSTQWMKNHGITPKHVIPPGIDTSQFIGKSLKDIDLLAAGSLIPLKSYEIFINLVRSIKERLPAVKAILIGEGPERAKLEAMIRESGLENNLSLTGEIPYSDVLRLMQRSKVFIHPSSYEGFGMVCLEALAAGAHVISFLRPMFQPIPHWFVASDFKEMEEETFRILADPQTRFEKIVFKKISETAESLYKLAFSAQDLKG